ASVGGGGAGLHAAAYALAPPPFDVAPRPRLHWAARDGRHVGRRASEMSRTEETACRSRTSTASWEWGRPSTAGSPDAARARWRWTRSRRRWPTRGSGPIRSTG